MHDLGVTYIPDQVEEKKKDDADAKAEDEEEDIEVTLIENAI